MVIKMSSNANCKPDNIMTNPSNSRSSSTASTNCNRGNLLKEADDKLKLLTVSNGLKSVKIRTSVLEEGMEIVDERLNLFRQEINILLAYINITHDWIRQQFGVELINQDSQFFKNLHPDSGDDEIREIFTSLSMIKKQRQIPATIEHRHRHSNPIQSTSILDRHDVNVDVLNDEGHDRIDQEQEQYQHCHHDPLSEMPKTSKGTSVLQNQLEQPCLNELELEENQDCLDHRHEVILNETAQIKLEPEVEEAEAFNSVERHLQADFAASSNSQGSESLIVQLLQQDTISERSQQSDQYATDPVPTTSSNFLSPSPQPRHKIQTCSFCGLLFLNFSDLIKHYSAAHMTSRPPATFPCILCPKKFSSPSDLSRHVVSHKVTNRAAAPSASSKRIPGHQRNRNFRSNSSTLDSTHVTCMVCNKVMMKQVLGRHLREIHSNLRPFTCKFCEKRFPRNSTLQRHILTHVGERINKFRLENPIL